MKTYSFKEAHESGRMYRTVGSKEPFYRHPDYAELPVADALADYELEPEVIEFKAVLAATVDSAGVFHKRLIPFLGKRDRVRVEVIE